MKFKLILILLTLLFPYAIQSQQTNTKTIELQAIIQAQNSRIQKLDSTITHLKNENAHLKEVAEKDIDHAKSLINMTETIVEFIAVLLAVFIVVDGFIITKMFKQSNQIKNDHQTLKEEWEKTRIEINKLKKSSIRDLERTRNEIDKLKESSVKEGKELLKIMYFISEGDNRLDSYPEEAIQYYKKALDVRKDNAEVYTKLGDIHVRLGKFNDATNYYKESSKLSPRNSLILAKIGRAYRKSDNLSDAEKNLNEAMEIDGEDEVVLNEIGKIYLLNNEFNKAENIYQKMRLKSQLPPPGGGLIY